MYNCICSECRRFSDEYIRIICKVCSPSCLFSKELQVQEMSFVSSYADDPLQFRKSNIPQILQHFPFAAIVT